MSAEHKEALAIGRREARQIKAYLNALGARRPGRPVTRESIEARISALEAKLAVETDPLKQVDLRQSRLDAKDQLSLVEDVADISGLEVGFVEVAKSYSERKGISYAAWREQGVSAPALKAAGVPRTRRS